MWDGINTCYDLYFKVHYIQYIKMIIRCTPRINTNELLNTTKRYRLKLSEKYIPELSRQFGESLNTAHIYILY